MSLAEQFGPQRADESGKGASGYHGLVTFRQMEWCSTVAAREICGCDAAVGVANDAAGCT